MTERRQLCRGSEKAHIKYSKWCGLLPCTRMQPWSPTVKGFSDGRFAIVAMWPCLKMHVFVNFKVNDLTAASERCFVDLANSFGARFTRDDERGWGGGVTSNYKLQDNVLEVCVLRLLLFLLVRFSAQIQTSMSVRLIVRPRCRPTLAASHSAPGELRWVCRRDKETDRQTDARPLHHAFRYAYPA